MPVNGGAQSTLNPPCGPLTVRFCTVILSPATPLVTMPPLKRPSLGSWPVIVLLAPSSVNPFGTMKGEVASQLAFSVIVVPLTVPGQFGAPLRLVAHPLSVLPTSVAIEPASTLTPVPGCGDDPVAPIELESIRILWLLAPTYTPTLVPSPVKVLFVSRTLLAPYSKTPVESLSPPG